MGFVEFRATNDIKLLIKYRQYSFNQLRRTTYLTFFPIGRLKILKMFHICENKLMKMFCIKKECVKIKSKNVFCHLQRFLFEDFFFPSLCMRTIFSALLQPLSFISLDVFYFFIACSCDFCSKVTLKRFLSTVVNLKIITIKT